MIYECLVIDNKNFFVNGTIRVRIKSLSMDRNMMTDLSEDPIKKIRDDSEQVIQRRKDKEELKYNDQDVLLMTSIGGAYDYGVFFLPQPNTYGFVEDLAAPHDNTGKIRYVWIGSASLFNNVTKTANIPSDDLVNPNGFNEGEMNLQDPYAGLVFKQKETHISESVTNIDENCSDNLNWKVRPTLNMFVVNGEKIWVVHNNFNEDGEQVGQSQIQLTSEGVNINYFNQESSCNAQFVMNNDGSFNIMNENSDEDAKVTNILSADSTSVSLTHTDNSASMGLYMGSDQNGSASCNLNFKGKSDKIPTELTMGSESGIMINSASNISINPGSNCDVTLGTGQGYILTSNAPGTWNYDDHTVTAVKTARA